MYRPVPGSVNDTVYVAIERAVAGVGTMLGETSVAAVVGGIETATDDCVVGPLLGSATVNVKFPSNTGSDTCGFDTALMDNVTKPAGRVPLPSVHVAVVPTFEHVIPTAPLVPVALDEPAKLNVVNVGNVIVNVYCVRI